MQLNPFHRFDHCHDIFHRCNGLDIMHRIDNNESRINNILHQRFHGAARVL
jgi:hypothetical protein